MSLLLCNSNFFGFELGREEEDDRVEERVKGDKDKRNIMFYRKVEGKDEGVYEKELKMCEKDEKSGEKRQEVIKMRSINRSGLRVIEC